MHDADELATQHMAGFARWTNLSETRSCPTNGRARGLSGADLHMPASKSRLPAIPRSDRPMPGCKTCGASRVTAGRAEVGRLCGGGSGTGCAQEGCAHPIQPVSLFTKNGTMRDTDFDVIIAACLIPDPARQDFDALVELVADDHLRVEASPSSAATPTARHPWMRSCRRQTPQGRPSPRPELAGVAAEQGEHLPQPTCTNSECHGDLSESSRAGASTCPSPSVQVYHGRVAAPERYRVVRCGRSSDRCCHRGRSRKVVPL